MRESTGITDVVASSSSMRDSSSMLEVGIREKLKLGYCRYVDRHVFTKNASQNGNGIRVIF
jgi:hypothetical protein